MLAQVLNVPRKYIKSLITNKVTTIFMTFLCTSITCTINRISISGFGIIMKLSKQSLKTQKSMSQLSYKSEIDR